jgi:hypothetical protein
VILNAYISHAWKYLLQTSTNLQDAAGFASLSLFLARNSK